MPSLWKSTPKKKSKSAIAFEAFGLRSGFAAIAVTLVLCGCAAPEAQVGLSDLSARPGEKALLAGIRAYEDAEYPAAEQSLTEALKAGFTVSKDAAMAHKYLAFIYCTSARIEECKHSFEAARAADPSFTLSKKEIGHPQWGPVYKQTLGE